MLRSETMSKLQKYLCAGIVVLVLAGVGWQYVGWQKQIVRHENALNFWKVEVPKMQKKFPQFKPQNSDQQIAAENKQFAEQKKAPYVNSGIIVLMGLLASGAVFYVPKYIPKYFLKTAPKKVTKKK
jgi:predicted negative regulator of RcsB-dependent stress response